jgi:DNA-binding SARP family transcriptional activator/Tfp pilus assembly protein PilF
VLEISLLGGLQIYLDGEPLTGLASRKAEALLAYLVCEPRPHAREVLATLLWDDRSQKQALGNLRVLLSSLRKHLAAYIQTTRGTVAFNTRRPYRLDVADLEGQISSILDKTNPGAWLPPTTADQLERALDLYQGAFLEGFYLRDGRGFEEWASLKRERLARLVSEAMRSLVVCHLRRRKYATGIDLATRLVEIDPLREDGHRYLMLLLTRSGGRNAALAQYQTCCQILDRELGIEPTAETTALYERIRRSRPGRVYNLPDYLTPFVGRETELALIFERLNDPNCRLLTLVGPGGTGKSRLAAQFAQAAANEIPESFHQGLYYCSLAQIGSAETLAGTIAGALKFPLRGKQSPQEQLLDYLRHKEILLVLDNFEHLVDSADLLLELLKTAPGIKLLVTSRRPLNLRAEWLLEIRGLAYPRDSSPAEDFARIAAYSAVQLFTEIARRVQPTFSLQTAAPDVIRICDSVQGMPLAIELSASWLSRVSCSEVAGQVDHNIDFLATTMRDVPERHRSIRGVFEGSYQLLSMEEKRVLRRTAVFRGEFSWSAAIQVIGLNGNHLSALVERSLLRKTSPKRCEIHGLLRQFTQEKLAEDPSELQQVNAAHARYYADFLEEREKALHGRTQRETIQEIAQEIENLRGAWRWALSEGMLTAIDRTTRGLSAFYELQSWYQEARDVFSSAVSALREIGRTDLESSRLLGRLLTHQGLFDTYLGRYGEARSAIEEGLSLLRATGSQADISFALVTLGRTIYELSEFTQAQAYFEESLAIEPITANPIDRASAHDSLGDIHRIQGNFEAAQQHYQTVLEIYTQLGDEWGLAIAHNSLGILFGMMGQYAQAEANFQSGLQTFRALGDRSGIARNLQNLSILAFLRKEFTEAKRLRLECLEICRDIGYQWGVGSALKHLADAEMALGEYDNAQNHYEESLEIAENAEDRKSIAYTLSSLGDLAVKQGDLGRARHNITQAIQTAVEIDLIPVAVNGLIGIAKILIEEHHLQSAVELLGFVGAFHGVEQQTKDKVARILGDLEGQLPENEMKACLRSGEAQDLDSVLNALITQDY